MERPAAPLVLAADAGQRGRVGGRSPRRPSPSSLSSPSPVLASASVAIVAVEPVSAADGALGAVAQPDDGPPLSSSPSSSLRARFRRGAAGLSRQPPLLLLLLLRSELVPASPRLQLADCLGMLILVPIEKGETTRKRMRESSGDGGAFCSMGCDENSTLFFFLKTLSLSPSAPPDEDFARHRNNSSCYLQVPTK